MTGIFHLNSIHLNYLTPLLKWRVMDLESLRQECYNEPNYFNFCKIIRSLEKANVLEGYVHPFNRKKYVYLSPLGEGQLSIKENPSAVSKDTLIHDIKVSELTRTFLDLGWVENAELEHQLHDKRNFKSTYKIIPDALLEGQKRGIQFKMALELELTRKNNQRIIEKARQYLSSSYYDYVLYFFSKRKLMETYISLLQTEFAEDEMKHFMFFVDEGMSIKPTDLTTITGSFKGREVKLIELFGQLNGS